MVSRLLLLLLSIQAFTKNHSADASLRLVDGPDVCTGRVEVYQQGQWGTVCSHGWDLHDAHVVCRQLGCGQALFANGKAEYGQGNGSIWLSKVECSGFELSLTECHQSATHDCSHDQDAGVICEMLTPSLRLVGGFDACAGRVEVYHQDQWKTVCGHSWDLQDAQVVCRQQGCGEAVNATGNAKFGVGSCSIWQEKVNCLGSEQLLSECDHQSIDTEDCSHDDDAGVLCDLPAPPVRLVNDNPSEPCSGRVEMYMGQWGTVCGHAWDLQDADVVCKQLNCGPAVSTTSNAHFGQGSGPIWMSDVECSGSESSLAECSHTHGNCGHHEDAGVVCRSASPEIQPIPPTPEG